MNTAELIYQESKDLPESEARAVLDFVSFLKDKMRKAQLSTKRKSTTMNEFDKFGLVFDGCFNRDDCYDRPHIR